MRHGQADNNVNRVLVGRHAESHLTDYGRKQVLDTARFLKKVAIDKIYSSPVTRATETAQLICEELGMEYEIDERLYEIELGKLVGMKYDDIIQKYGNLFLKFYADKDLTLEDYGVETFASVKRRITNFLHETVEKHQDRNVLTITHLDPIKAALALTLDLKPQLLYGWHIHNASLTILKHQNRSYALTGVNIMGLNRYMDE